MTEDVRGEDLEALRSELAKQRANNERLTFTLREARSQIITLKAEVDPLPAADPAALAAADAQCLEAFRKAAEQSGATLPAGDAEAMARMRAWLTEAPPAAAAAGKAGGGEAGKVTVKMINDARAPDFAEGQTVRLGWMAADCFAFRTDTYPPQGGRQ